MWEVYLLSKLSALGIFFIIGSALVIVGFGVAFIILLCVSNDPYTTEKEERAFEVVKRWGEKYLWIFGVLFFIGFMIPERSTLALMFGVDYLQEIKAVEKVESIGAKGLEVLEKRLDEELKGK